MKRIWVKRDKVAPQRGLKHIPQRTCVFCREVKPKRQLVRVVYSAGGIAEVDVSGKKPGRGAYVCRSPGCWGKGLSKGRLEHALRGKIDPENWVKVVEFGTGFCSEAQSQLTQAVEVE